jgi:SAM-dependent methyltransferase
MRIPSVVTIQRAADLPIPPQSLRHRVHGANDVDSFLEAGRQRSQSLIGALAQIGEPIERFESVLDFGCGSGHILRWMLPLLSAQRICGSDTDREAIAWCARHIPQAHFTVNSGQPPTSFANHSFDLIYAISVFPHLNEAHQFHWLAELQRITRPGGIVLLSVHGTSYKNGLPTQTAAELAQSGCSCVASDGRKDVLPDRDQIAFHTTEYVNRYYSRFFEVAAYIDRGMSGVQDLVALRRRPTEDALIQTMLAEQNRTQVLESKVQALEQQLDLKNQHIDMLEALLEKIGQGRVMRVLNTARRLVPR